MRALAIFTTLAITAILGAACSAAEGDGDVDAAGRAGTIANNGAGGDEVANTFGQGGSSSGFAGESCGESSFASSVPGTLLVVLDRSGSMGSAPEGGGPTKWSSTVSSMNAMTSAADPALRMGLLAFPDGKAGILDDGCKDVASQPHVPIAALSTSASAINGWLQSNDVVGNTPTLWALRNGYAALASDSAPGSRYLLLITDGVPTLKIPGLGPLPDAAVNCGTEEDIEQEVASAASGPAGIKTFVIGSPGSEEAGSFLSQLAVNGETPKTAACDVQSGACHYQIGSANFQTELQQVLDSIVGLISDCVFELPAGNQVDPGKVNITVATQNGEVEIYRDATHADGWDYSDASQSSVELYGAACDLYKESQGNSVEIILGCETVLK